MWQPPLGEGTMAPMVIKCPVDAHLWTEPPVLSHATQAEEPRPPIPRMLASWLHNRLSSPSLSQVCADLAFGLVGTGMELPPLLYMLLNPLGRGILVAGGPSP